MHKTCAKVQFMNDYNQNKNQSNQFTDDTLLSVSQVAALLQVSPVMVNTWISNGALPSHKTADGRDNIKAIEVKKHAQRHNIKLEGDINKITKVLIVDDDSHVADFLKDYLESRNTVYDVHRTGISFMAEKLVKRFHPHVMIIDLRMPGMDGIELCEHFKEQIHQGLRVIGISGYWSNDEKREFLEAGGIACLDKPLDIQKLNDLLELNREFGDGYPLNVDEIDPDDFNPSYE